MLVQTGTRSRFGMCHLFVRAGQQSSYWRFQPVRRRFSLNRSSLFPEIDELSHCGGILSKYVLKLYVAGSSARTDRAIANLRRICDEELANLYELVIIDVLEHPQLAEDDKILATPTLIKHLPPPLRRVIGDLSDKDKVLLGLEVRPASDNPSPPTTS
jgi:circadian clock protein KaiB